MLNTPQALPEPRPILGLEEGEVGLQGQLYMNRQWYLPGAFPHLITVSFWNFGEGGSLDSFQSFMLSPDLVTNCEIKISVYDGCAPH